VSVAIAWASHNHALGWQQLANHSVGMLLARVGTKRFPTRCPFAETTTKRLSACAELISATARTTISQYFGAFITAPPVAAALVSENAKWRTAVPTERMQGRSRSKATPANASKSKCKNPRQRFVGEAARAASARACSRAARSHHQGYDARVQRAKRGRKAAAEGWLKRPLVLSRRPQPHGPSCAPPLACSRPCASMLTATSQFWL